LNPKGKEEQIVEENKDEEYEDVEKEEKELNQLG